MCTCIYVIPVPRFLGAGASSPPPPAGAAEAVAAAATTVVLVLRLRTDAEAAAAAAGICFGCGMEVDCGVRGDACVYTHINKYATVVSTHVYIRTDVRTIRECDCCCWSKNEPLWMGPASRRCRPPLPPVANEAKAETTAPLVLGRGRAEAPRVRMRRRRDAVVLIAMQRRVRWRVAVMGCVCL